MKNSFINQRGAIEILLSVLILAVILLIGMGISALTLAQIKMAMQAGQSVQALYAAEAGAEKCLYQTRNTEGEEGCAKVGNTINGALLNDKATYRAKRDEIKKITSSGSFGEVSRKIEITW